MSRSWKKNPAGGICKARSEKYHKQRTSRSTRHRNKQRIKAGKEIMALPHEVVNQFGGPKDGHTWFGDEVVKKYPGIIRK